MRLIDANVLMEKLNGIWDCNDMTFAPADECCIDADCKSCRWRETIEYVKRLVQNQPTASPWHRVEDELPRGQELVIVAIKDTAGDTPFWYTQCGWITTDGEYWIVDNEICDYVVAWMPLPEPPQEVRDADT